jgi:GxxExxY protein
VGQKRKYAQGGGETERESQDAPPGEPLTGQVIGLAMEVHRQLGPGLLESAYEECLAFEFASHGLTFGRQVPLPVVYKRVKLDCGYRLDLVVENRIVIEVKAVERLLPIHEAQVLTYLRLGCYPIGLLMNFNGPTLKDGLRRLNMSL